MRLNYPTFITVEGEPPLRFNHDIVARITANHLLHRESTHRAEPQSRRGPIRNEIVVVADHSDERLLHSALTFAPLTVTKQRSRKASFTQRHTTGGADF
jgi:hypothetical protein